MRINAPVTQREYDIPDGATLRSATNAHGTITYANDTFVAVSGYARADITSTEAARAGDQGRGVAVVAGKVCALAQRSATAAHDLQHHTEHLIEAAAVFRAAARGTASPRAAPPRVFYMATLYMQRMDLALL